VINLPTDLGMPLAERTESAMEELFRDGMNLIVLPESKFVVILEVLHMDDLHECVCAVCFELLLQKKQHSIFTLTSKLSEIQS